MPHWLAYVAGDQGDLEILAARLATPKCTIVRTQRGFAIASDAFDVNLEASEIRSRAKEIAADLSGSSMIVIGMRLPISVTNLGKVQDDGREDSFMFAEPAVAYARAYPVTISTKRADGTTESHHPVDYLNRLFQAQVISPSVSRALRIRARAPLEWDDIMRVIEIVQTESGGRPYLIAGAPSKNSLERLAQTANSVHVLDDRSRHPGKSFSAPSKPMSLTEAQACADQLLKSWLRSL